MVRLRVKLVGPRHEVGPRESREVIMPGESYDDIVAVIDDDMPPGWTRLWVRYEPFEVGSATA